MFTTITRKFFAVAIIAILAISTLAGCDSNGTQGVALNPPVNNNGGSNNQPVDNGSNNGTYVPPVNNGSGSNGPAINNSNTVDLNLSNEDQNAIAALLNNGLRDGTITQAQANDPQFVAGLAISYVKNRYANGQSHTPEIYNIQDDAFNRSDYTELLFNENVSCSAEIRDFLFGFFNPNIDAAIGKGWIVPASGQSSFEQTLNPGGVLWISTGHVTVKASGKMWRFNCGQDQVEQVFLMNSSSSPVTVNLSAFYNPGTGSELFPSKPSLELTYIECFERALDKSGDTLDGSGKKKNFCTFIDVGTGELLQRLIMTGDVGAVNIDTTPYTY